MLFLRKSNERGHFQHGWLDTYHSFSFADYFDPDHMNFGVLRVINEDYIAGGQGFGTHPHRDMEIITYILEGALEHQDSMENSARILPGEVQRMSAGTGVQHSERNPLPTTSTHLLQIWILPNRKNHSPGYEQKSFAAAIAQKGFVLVASEKGREGSVSLNQDVDLYVGKPLASLEIVFDIRAERKVWVQVVRGSIVINAQAAESGDGIGITEESQLKIRADAGSEFLLFDLP